MPRSNHKALSIHIIFFFALFLTSVIIPHISFAQEQETAESPQEEASEKKAPVVGSPIVELIKDSLNKKSQMKSMSWSNKKYKKKIAKEKELEEATEAEVEDEEETEVKEEELTEESKKIWKHYNSLSKRIKEKKEESNNSDEPKEDKDKEEKTADAKTKEDKDTKDEEETPASEGLTDILQRYKETQKKQGPMNSRSFGSID